jgi:hypothetical protein
MEAAWGVVVVVVGAFVTQAFNLWWPDPVRLVHLL